MNKMRYFGPALRMAPQYVRTLSHDSKDNKSSNTSLALRWAMRYPIPTVLLALTGLGVSGFIIWRFTDEGIDIKTQRGSVEKNKKTLPLSQQTISNNEFGSDVTINQVHGDNNTVIHNHHYKSSIKTPYLPIKITLPEYYTPTLYEKVLKEKLATKPQKVKRIAITGTAGSGKTTLAGNFLQNYQESFPNHLTAILLAETERQWWSSLQDLAKSLSPGFEESLKSEKKEEEQKKLTTQVIQNILKEKHWCVIIDNWDANGGIDIDKITSTFNVGEGTYLITTQNESSFLKEAHLDLSVGITLGESRLLLSKILTPLTEKTKQALGGQEEQDRLITNLNKLPLGLTQAGNYILLENAERQKHGDIAFTYKDYCDLLQEKIDVLISKHEKLFKGKPDVPKITQEASVSLSIQKAIRSNTDSPDINLWKILCFCGFLASDEIPQQLLKNYLNQLSNVTKSSSEELFSKLLNSYSLFQFEGKRSLVDKSFNLHMHRVIQQVLRDEYWPKLLKRLYTDDYNRSLVRFLWPYSATNIISNANIFSVGIKEYTQCVEVWLKLVPERGDFPNYMSALLDMIHQGKALLENFRFLEQPELSEQDRYILLNCKIRLQQAIAQGEIHLAHYAEAEKLLKNIQDEENKCQGRLPLEMLARTLWLWGVWYDYQKNKEKEALFYYKKSLIKIAQALFYYQENNSHDKKASKIAQVFHEKIYNSLSEEEKKSIEEKDGFIRSDLAEIISILTVAIRRIGVTKSIDSTPSPYDYLWAAYEIYEIIEPVPDHFTVDFAGTLHLIGNIDQKIGNQAKKQGDQQKVEKSYQDARKHYTKSMQILHEKYDKKYEHSNLAGTLFQLGRVCYELGRYEGSLQYYENSQAMRYSLSGKDAKDPYIGGTNFEMGRAYEAMNECDKAKEKYTKALDIFKTIYGNDHHEVTKVLGCIERIDKCLSSISEAPHNIRKRV